MKKPAFSDALNEILASDTRYDENAYLFVREALDFTIKLLNKPKEGPNRHVRGSELLEGLRQYALQEFGPLAKNVLTASKEVASLFLVIFSVGVAIGSVSVNALLKGTVSARYSPGSVIVT